MARHKKNPWFAAVLNLIIWGLGYIYNGKRIAAGILLLISDILLTLIWVLFTPSAGMAATLLPFLLVTIAFMYDGYGEAKEMNKR